MPLPRGNIFREISHPESALCGPRELQGPRARTAVDTLGKKELPSLRSRQGADRLKGPLKKKGSQGDYGPWSTLSAVKISAVKISREGNRKKFRLQGKRKAMRENSGTSARSRPRRKKFRGHHGAKKPKTKG